MRAVVVHGDVGGGVVGAIVLDLDVRAHGARVVVVVGGLHGADVHGEHRVDGPLAAERGITRVLWTTGRTQIERYEDSMRQAVDEMEWKKEGYAQQNVLVVRKGKIDVMREHGCRLYDPQTLERFA